MPPNRTSGASVFIRAAFVLAMLALCALPCFAQANLFDHLFWQAYGTHDGREWGGSGLDTLGKINDTIPHAITIAEAGGAPNGAYVASFVYNRTKLASAPDTSRH